MIAGTLEIQMMANMARLAADMHAAKNTVGGAMKSVEGAVASAKSALGSLGIAMSAITLIYESITWSKNIIDTADHLNDLSQSLGINLQELSKYQLATAQSGTSLEGLGKGIKGLNNAFAAHGDELRAVGITAKSSDGQMRQLADVFSAMPDGVEKSTLAVKTFGKFGMELIPMLNKGSQGLAETAEKSAKYAAVMATLGPQADKFNDTMTELGMVSKVAGMSIIDGMLPAMNKVSGAMAIAAQESGTLMAAWVGLGGIGWETIFRPASVIIKGVTNDLDEMILRMQTFLHAAPSAIAERQAAIDSRWKEIAGMTTDAAPAAAPKAFDTAAWLKQYKAMMAALGAGGAGAGAGASPVVKSQYDAIDKGLTDQILKTQQLSVYETTLFNIEQKRYGFLPPAQAQDLLAKAQSVDLIKKWQDNAKAATAEIEKQAKAQQALDDARTQAAANLWNATRTPFEQYTNALGDAKALLDASAISWDTYQRAAAAALVQLDSKTAVAGEKFESIWKKAAKDSQTAMATGFYDILSGKTANFGRVFRDMTLHMVSDWMAAQAQMALFGNFGKTGQFGGLAGAALNYFTGSQAPAPVVEASFASGTNYVPHDMIAQIHQGERITPAGGGDTQVIVYDMRTSASAAPVQVTEQRGSSGQRLLYITVRDMMRQANNSGDMDNTNRNNYGLNRPTVQR